MNPPETSEEITNTKILGNPEPSKAWNPTGQNASKADSTAFTQCFHNGLEFWTSEDGTLMAVVIDREEGWEDRLRFHHRSLWQHEPFSPAKAQPRFVYRHWAGADFYDGGFQRKGKIWSLSDKPTPFPVMYYELALPR